MNPTDNSIAPALEARELAALASQCYGPNWQSPLARDMEINVRTVQRWARGGIDKSATAENVRRFLTDRRVASIPAPDASMTEDERDDACYDAMETPLSALASAADDQGWHPAEVWVAVMAIAADRLYAMAGRTATIETIAPIVTELQGRPERQD